jgi:hypothetical protein
MKLPTLGNGSVSQFLRCLVTAALLGVFLPSLRAQVARLILHSEPGDYIGLGEDHDVTFAAESASFMHAWVGTLTQGLPSDVYFSFLGSSTAANLYFGTAAMGIPLQMGAYPNATQNGDATHPRIHITFSSRGCDNTVGNFTIQEFAYTAGQPVEGIGFTIDRFTVTFEQRCEGGRDPPLFGTFIYTVPEPSVTWMLFGALLIVGLWKTRGVWKGNGSGEANSVGSKR